MATNKDVYITLLVQRGVTMAINATNDVYNIIISWQMLQYHGLAKHYYIKWTVIH